MRQDVLKGKGERETINSQQKLIQRQYNDLQNEYKSHISIIEKLENEINHQKDINIKALDIENVLRNYIVDVESKIELYTNEIETEKKKKKEMLKELSNLNEENSRHLNDINKLTNE